MNYEEAKKLWDKNMLSFGEKHAVTEKKILTDWKGGKPNPDFNPIYYDGARVFYNIYDYTLDKKWLDAAQVAVELYRDTYLIPNKGSLPGYWIFPHGLARHFKETNDQKSYDAVMMLSNNAAYSTDLDKVGHGDYLKSANSSRECAYAIMSHLVAESLGKVREKKTDDRIRNCYGHFDQWFVAKTWVPQPFMVGLACEALKMWFLATGDPKVLPAMKMAADGLMETHWRDSNQSFVYADPPERMEETIGAPDLNLLILPIFSEVALATRDKKYQDWADKIFIGGVQSAFLGNGKQFNQNFRNSFDSVKNRIVVPDFPMPTPDQIKKILAVRAGYNQFVKTLVDNCPDSTRAILKLEESLLQAEASIMKG